MSNNMLNTPSHENYGLLNRYFHRGPESIFPYFEAQKDKHFKVSARELDEHEDRGYFFWKLSDHVKSELLACLYPNVDGCPLTLKMLIEKCKEIRSYNTEFNFASKNTLVSKALLTYPIAKEINWLKLFDIYNSSQYDKTRISKFFEHVYGVDLKLASEIPDRLVKLYDSTPHGADTKLIDDQLYCCTDGVWLPVSDLCSAFTIQVLDSGGDLACFDVYRRSILPISQAATHKEAIKKAILLAEINTSADTPLARRKSIIVIRNKDNKMVFLGSVVECEKTSTIIWKIPDTIRSDLIKDEIERKVAELETSVADHSYDRAQSIKKEISFLRQCLTLKSDSSFSGIGRNEYMKTIIEAEAELGKRSGARAILEQDLGL